MGGVQLTVVCHSLSSAYASSSTQTKPRGCAGTDPCRRPRGTTCGRRLATQRHGLTRLDRHWCQRREPSRGAMRRENGRSWGLTSQGAQQESATREKGAYLRADQRQAGRLPPGEGRQHLGPRRRSYLGRHHQVVLAMVQAANRAAGPSMHQAWPPPETVEDGQGGGHTKAG